MAPYPISDTDDVEVTCVAPEGSRDLILDFSDPGLRGQLDADGNGVIEDGTQVDVDHDTHVRVAGPLFFEADGLLGSGLESGVTVRFGPETLVCRATTTARNLGSEQAFVAMQTREKDGKRWQVGPGYFVSTEMVALELRGDHLPDQAREERFEERGFEFLNFHNAAGGRGTRARANSRGRRDGGRQRKIE